MNRFPAAIRFIVQSLDNRRRRLSNVWTNALRRLAGLSLLLGAALWIAVRVAPFPEDQLARYPASVVLTDRSGGALRVRLGPDDLDCRPTYQPQADHWIAQAIIAAEDQRFWSHPGVDPLALLRAVRQNLGSLRRVSGASTLSTQVIRLVEPRPRTLATKAIEAFRALQLEHRHSKHDILAQYLNRAPFGGNIVGIEAASGRYFGKRPEDLSLAEASLLAGVPQSPSRGRPDRHPARAAQRRAYVLERMEACGFITARQRAEALAQPVAVRAPAYPFRAPHFAAMVGLPRLADETPVLRTTLDPALQRLAEDTLSRHLAHGPASGALVILEVGTGAVRALVGSPDFASPRSGQVNGALAPRSAGSTLKPFAYALALDRGFMTPQTVLADVPLRYRDYAPQNFDGAFLGLVPLRDALVLSLNMPALETVRRIGPDRFHGQLRRLGLLTLDRPTSEYGLGLALGNGEVRLLDLAGAYACLAREGIHLPPRVLEEVPAAPGKRLFSPEACWLIADMLSGDERAMDATGHAADAELPRFAWKTGTSAGLRDAWTIAYNPEYVIGVWAGQPEGASAPLLVGRSLAAPIAWDVARQLYPRNRSPWFAKPALVQTRQVCAASGQPPGRHCGALIEDWRIAQVTRHEPCAAHRAGPEAVWPAPVAAFLRTRRGEESATAVPASPRIVSPVRDGVYAVWDALSAESQRIPLDAELARSGEPLYWFVNDRLVGQSRPGAPLLWPPEPGTHSIVCSTPQGQSDRIRITVR